MSYFDDDDDQIEDNHDTIEADIIVAAPLEKVWAVISEPGWWINAGPMGDHEVDIDDEGIHHIADPEVGRWLVEKLEEDPMDVAAFRWYPLAGDELPDEYATRIEVSISEENKGVAVHIEETGLSRVSDDEEVALTAWEDAQGMWDDALAQLKNWLEG